MKKFNRLLTKFLATALAAAGASVVSAAPLTGAISTAGTICLGSTPTTPTTAQCTSQDASTLTFLDFINGSLTSPAGLTPTPGQPGAMNILTTLGDDLEPLLGQIGWIHDFTLPGPGDPMSSFAGMDPLWHATGTDGAMYTYSLDELISVFRLNGHAIDVRGTGQLCRNDADCNTFSFLFTAQEAQGAIRTTFSMSQSGFGKVPEPGSLALLGLGLVGLAAGARRRRTK